MSPYFVRSSRNVSKTGPLAILCKFPMTGNGGGPGGYPIGLLDRTHSIIDRSKTNIMEIFGPPTLIEVKLTLSPNCKI